jgi:hypothetical protein
MLMLRLKEYRVLTTENLLKRSLVPCNLKGLTTSGSTVLIFCVYLHRYQGLVAV